MSAFRVYVFSTHVQINEDTTEQNFFKLTFPT